MAGAPPNAPKGPRDLGSGGPSGRGRGGNQGSGRGSRGGGRGGRRGGNNQFDVDRLIREMQERAPSAQAGRSTQAGRAREAAGSAGGREPTGPASGGQNEPTGNERRAGGRKPTGASSAAGETPPGRSEQAAGPLGRIWPPGRASTETASAPGIGFIPPPNYIDQADLQLDRLAGYSEEKPKCISCGLYKVQECVATYPEDCVVTCMYCKQKDHKGKPCPRLWCDKNWWMTHWHQMPPAGQALRPTEEEAKKLVAEGNTWIEKHWKPMPGNLKRKADEAGLTEDPLKVERSKRLVAQRLNTRLRARLEPLEEENEALKEEIARLKAAMQQSGPARATHGSTEEVKSSAPPVANRGDLGTTQGGMDRLTENLVDRLAAVEAMLRIQRQDQLPAVEAAVWAPDVDRHIEIKEEPASPVTNWSDLGATHAGGDPFAAAGTVLENDQVAVKQNVGEGPRGDSLEAAEAVLSPRREDE